jgi:transposase
VPDRADRPTPTDDALRDELARTRRDNARLRNDVARLERERGEWQRERERLRRENERLKDDLEAARRAGARQAAPFSKGAPTPHPKRPGRKSGARHGRHGQRPVPPRIDETHDAPLPPACPHCGGTVHETRVADQYHEDLPPVRPVVRRFRIHIGRCTRCHRRVQGRHPWQTSDALGAAAVQLGPHAIALAVTLNKQFGVSFGKIATLFHQRLRLTLTRGAIVRALHRTARHAAPTYEALCQAVRGSPMVSPDETGWRVNGRLHWLWAFATPDTTVYAIRKGRGFPEAASILGADFGGVLVRDGWAPYRQFTHAAHQTCLAHLLRRARLLHQDHPHARLPSAVHDLLRQALALRDRHHAGTVSAHGLAVARGRLIAALGTVLDRTSSVADVERFAAHLSVEFPAIFSFLFDPTLDATNWRAEQALRPAVVTRKMAGGGNRSLQGAATQQVLASVLRTAHLRDLDAVPLVVDLLRAPMPTVSAALQVPRQ